MEPEEVFETFTDKFGAVCERTNRWDANWIAPIGTEIERQLKSRNFDGGRLASAVNVAKGKPGYHQDFGQVLQWLVDNWPYGGIQDVTLTTGTGIRSTGNIGDRWLETIQQKQEVETTQVPEMIDTGRDPLQTLKNAFKALGLWEQRKAWRTYFRNLSKNPVLASTSQNPKKKDDLLQAVATAQRLIDPLLTSRVIVNDNLLNALDPTMQSSQTDETQINAVLSHYGLDNPSTAVHWYAKGAIIDSIQRIQIRCDGSAALVFYKLYSEGEFSCPLGIISQGDPGSVGHWFVVAGHKSYLDPSSDKHHQRAFVVDLWGAGITGRDSAVAYPPETLGMTGGELRLVCTV